MRWSRQVSAAPPGCGSRVRPVPVPRLPWRLHEPLRPSGGGVARLRVKRGCRGAARGRRGKAGGARQALVPSAPAGSAAARGAPPAPGLHACKRLEEPAREPTASASPTQRLGRSSPRSGDNCAVGWLRPPAPSPGPCPPPPSAALRGSFERREEGAGRAPRAWAGGERRRGRRWGLGFGLPRPSGAAPSHISTRWVAGSEKSRLC